VIQTYYTITLLYITILFTGCKKQGSDFSDQAKPIPNISGSQLNAKDWTIPEQEVRDGGPGKDGIPSIDNPKFTSKENISFMNDNDLIVGLQFNGTTRGYPHNILDWHEIINDQFEGKEFALVYCPLTGTATAWNRKINGISTTFGVSGLLFNSNVIPYDRATGSNWSQLKQECINGSLIETKIENFPFIETSWATWKELFPEAQVASSNTGHNRNYSTYPYGDYKTNQDFLLFPVNHTDNRLHQKERVLAVYNPIKKAYSFDSFNTETTLIEDADLLIIGNQSKNFITAFKKHPNHSYTAKQNSLPIVMIDETGSEWDIFGKAVSGDSQGEALEPTTSYMGYWFAIAAFEPGIALYGQ